VTEAEKDSLPWPMEAAQGPKAGEPSFQQAGTNICLDFHGDPLRAKLVVFSDGNHHMALEECAAAFLAANPDVGDIFYATTPPGPLAEALEKGVLHVGNLALSASPNLFIGPEDFLDRLAAAGTVDSHQVFAESRGNVLLVRHGNPKGIGGVADLMRDDVRIAISNPMSEKASFRVYCDTLVALAVEAGLEGAVLRERLTTGSGGVVFSTAIHHREIPQILADGTADGAGDTQEDGG